MTDYRRFAIYFTAPGSLLAERGATWLGWDIAQGAPSTQPDGLADVTKTPRKYGFHGTLKPPFVLADGFAAEDLAQSARRLAQGLNRFHVPGLKVSRLGRFLALTTDDTEDLRGLASACVTELDQFRAPPSDAELARRRARPLSPAQDALLERWGYPFVMEEFRFHMTLTGRMADTDFADVTARAEEHFSAPPDPQPIDAITLCGERQDGNFEAIEAMPLR
ncbi:MAG: DUF1045 domain-containing protein [Pseudomonadota bacterium]